MNEASTTRLIEQYRSLPEREREAFVTCMLTHVAALNAEMNRLLSNSQASTYRFHVHDVAVTVDILPTGAVGMTDSVRKAQTVTITGQQGQLLAFALLKKAEGRPVLDYWGAAFCRFSSTPTRVGKLYCDISRTIEREAPQLKLKFIKVPSLSHTRAAGPQHAIKLAQDVIVSSSPEEAAHFIEGALEDYKDHRYLDAAKKAHQAITACPLFYPAYPVFMDCLAAIPEAETTDAEALAEGVAIASNSMSAWLEGLKRGFNLAVTPRSLRKVVTAHCIGEIDGRAEKLRQLRLALQTKNARRFAQKGNPLNALIAAIRDSGGRVEPTWGPESAEVRGALRRVFEEVRGQVEDSPEVAAFQRREGLINICDVASDSLIYAEILTIARETPTFVFPEAGDDSLRWVNQSAVIIARRIVKGLLSQHAE